MVCEFHPKKKQGRCNNCDNYKCCEPKQHCIMKNTHLPRKISLKRKGKSPKAVRVSKRGNAAKNTNYKEESDSEIDETLSVLPFSGKDRWTDRRVEETISQVEINAISRKKHQSLLSLIEEIPKQGFSDSDVTTNTRSYRRAKLLFNSIVEKLSTIMFPDDPQRTKQFDRALIDNEAKYDKMAQCIGDLYLFGAPNVSVVCSSLLSISLSHKDVNILVQQRIAAHNASLSTIKLTTGRTTFGKFKFKTYRAKFSRLVSGEGLEKQKYIFRVNPTKIASSIEFVQDNLPVVAGLVRDVKFDGHVFRNLPVYSSGGKSLMKFYDLYKTLYPIEDRIGRDNFLKVSKLLCKKGEIRAGLSTYYVRIRDTGEVIGRMIKRMIDLYPTLKGECDNLTLRWTTLESFFTHEYRAKHLELDSNCKQHCCKYGLNILPTCLHNHDLGVCKSCDEDNAFFLDLNNSLTSILLELEDEDNKAEVRTMLRASTEIFQNTLTAYKAHQMRGYAQFAKLKLEISHFSEKRCGLWFDHKQKINPMRYSEGQIEYFGKRGMSLLGFMLVRRTKRIVKEVEKVGLSYTFYDVIIDKYSSQDNCQVLACLDNVIAQIQLDYPDVNQLMLGSDNASCLASHDNIPCIHHLNSKIDIFLRNWIYTEACMGKNRLDTHFSFVNMMLKAYVLDGNDIVTELDIFEALLFNGGLVGTRVILLDGNNLKGPVLQDKKEFKATKTGVRETHEIIWSNTVPPETPKVLTISDITPPEIITARKLSGYRPNILIASISKTHKSMKAPLFIPDVVTVVGEEGENTVDNQSQSAKTIAISVALQNCEIEFGPRNIEHNEHEYDNSTHTNLQQGWARYPKQKRNPPMSRATLVLLHEIFTRGNQNKDKRSSADRAKVTIFEDVAEKNWHEQALVSETRIKAFFGATLAAQSALISDATRLEAEAVPPAVPPTAPQSPLVPMITQEMQWELENLMELECWNSIRHTDAENANLSSDM